MSIKGKSKELYVGNSEVSILDFWGNKRAIKYSELKQVSYHYAGKFRSGFINFITHIEKNEKVYFSANANAPIRKTIDFIKEHAPNVSIIELERKENTSNTRKQPDLNFNDPLTMNALKLIISRQKASIGMIQRSLNISYERAAKIMDELINSEIVSKPHGTAPFKVRLSQKDFEHLKNTPFISNTTNRNFDCMNGYDFELFCTDLLYKNGFSSVIRTPGSGDHGIDILAEKDGISYAIQCKCYSENIGNKAIQEAHTGKSIYKRDIAVVLSNRYFTDQAIEEARLLGVKLWDRNILIQLINNVK